MPNADDGDPGANGAPHADLDVGDWCVEDREVAVDECGRLDAYSQAVVYIDGRLDVGDHATREYIFYGVGREGWSVVVC